MDAGFGPVGDDFVAGAVENTQEQIGFGGAGREVDFLDEGGPG